MSARVRVTVLGCGASSGTPRINGSWGACDPDDPRNRRMRSSVLFERMTGDGPWTPETSTTVLIDTSPDMHAQLIASGTTRLDAVFYSHDHADQAHGIDDLRGFYLSAGARVPVYMDERTASVLTDRFRYLFDHLSGSLYKPVLSLQSPLLEPFVARTIEGPGGPMTLVPLAQSHGPIDSLGFRVGPIAYSNDVVDMPDATFDALAGVKTWIVDALRYREHVTHAHLAKTLGWIERVGVERAILTNMTNELDYAVLDGETPSHVSPGYDGLRLEEPLLG